MDILFALPIVIAAAFVRGATGFGFSLLAAPLFALFWPATFASTVVLVLDLAATGLLVRGGILAGLDWREAAVLGVAALVGALVGVLLLSLLPQRPALIGLNLAVLVSALAALFKVRWRWVDTRAAAIGASFLTGSMIGAFSVGGTLVVAWLMASGRSPAQARALLTIIFAVTDSGAIASRLAFGLFPTSSLTIILMLLPALAAGIYFGRRFYGRLSPEAWKRGVSALLVLLALVSLARTLTLS